MNQQSIVKAISGVNLAEISSVQLIKLIRASSMNDRGACELGLVPCIAIAHALRRAYKDGIARGYALK